MRVNGLLLGFLVPAIALLGACGGGGGSGGSGGGGTGGSTGGAADCSANLTPIANADYCASQAGDVNCAIVTAQQKYNSCGVALKEPPAALLRSSTVMEYSGTGDPQTSCFDAGSYPAKPGASQNVTVKGTAVIFSHGCSSNDLTIEFHKVVRGGADDGDVGDLIGTAVVTDKDCSVTGVSSMEETCDPARYECIYEYPNVPTETELVVKTSGDLWAPLYDYSIFIRNDQVQAGVWQHDVRALAADDYGVISQVAIGGPITAGNGAIAGEVHDCGDVRIQNAVLDVNVSRKALTYFGDDEAHPLPDLSKKGTSTLGLYSALDIAPGPVSISAAGKDKDGKMVGLGFLKVRVFPDSVTTVTFRGMNPILVP
ncbi:MAG: hypothetical protein U0441_25930 [Polyangiaceae bacterium]